MSAAGETLASVAVRPPAGGFDVRKIREDFPALRQQLHGRPLVYLDNAATTQKPRAVIEALRHFYEEYCANIHRGVHLLSERATQAYEDARAKVQRFLNAATSREIIFVRGATEGINLVAQTYGRANFRAGDEVLISAMEHHSNIVPWQMVCEEKGAVLRVAPMNDRGELLVEQFENLLTPRTKFVSLVHVSNALGTVNPVRDLIARAHRWNVPVLIDGAQAVPHLRADVQELGCDFYVFSGHKLFGPTGIGVLYGRQSLLEAMPPYQGGGDMISAVTFEKTTYNSLPYKFEAGTPNIAGTIGLGAAIDYVNQVGLEAAAAHEREVLEYATAAVSRLPGVRLIGTAPEKAGVLSFVIDGIHAHDVGTILDQQGIALRTGHHCAMPVMERFGVPATTRASFAFYNTKEEVEALVAGILKVLEVFR
jgi:cysteine desulfurase/selenocysteine lyase